MSNVNNIPASHLKLDKVYEYSYKGSVTVGARNELPVSALEFSSDIKITGSSDQKFFIQVGVAASVRECGAYPSCRGDKTGTCCLFVAGPIRRDTQPFTLTFSPTNNLVWPGCLCVDNQCLLNSFMF